MEARTTIFGGVWAKAVLTLLVAFAALLLSGNALAAGPSITSDQADYAPGSTVTLTGAGWGVGESVHIAVNDTVGQTCRWASNPDALAGLDGSFALTLTLPNYFISHYSCGRLGRREPSRPLCSLTGTFASS